MVYICAWMKFPEDQRYSPLSFQSECCLFGFLSLFSSGVERVGVEKSGARCCGPRFLGKSPVGSLNVNHLTVSSSGCLHNGFGEGGDRKSTRLNSSHVRISY